MKRPKLLFVFLIIVIMYIGYYVISKQGIPFSLAVHDSSKYATNTKLTLFIDGGYNLFSPAKGLDPVCSVNYFLINNTDDTLIYAGTECLYSKFYLANSSILTIKDFKWPLDSVKQLVLLPHHGIIGFVNLIPLKKLDSSFKFKIGLRLLKWKNGNTQAVLNRLANERIDTVWSDDIRPLKSDPINSYKTFKQEEARSLAASLKRPLWAFFPPITNGDRKNYVLTIDQKRIPKPKDTLMEIWDLETSKKYKKHFLYINCPLTLTNNTCDTLKYINLDCSWLDIYKIEAVNYRIADAPLCFHNVPNEIDVPPHSSQINYILLVAAQKLNGQQEIKIGMSLQKYWSRDQLGLFLPEYIISRPDINNMIWSNEVKIP